MAPGKFPNPPFMFDPKDGDLIGYLQGSCPRYLGTAAQGLIKRLNPSADLSRQREILRELWEPVVTDALKELKKNDPREWSKNPGIDSGSFFNEHSLGIDCLRSVQDAFGQFEALMYGARPDKYRDHVVHSFRVWIIGHGLLKRCLRGKLCTDNPPGVGIRANEWECIWALAALCHDIGYPLSALDTINEKTREALRPQGLDHVGDLRYVFSPRVQPLQETILKLMSSKLVLAPPAAKKPSQEFLTHLQNKYYLKFLNSFDRLEHGVISALIVGKSLVYFLESDLSQDSREALSKEDARQFQIRRDILRAMAAHTCPEIYHLRFDTLSFLLFIVDELQSWGRPTLKQVFAGTDSPEEDEVRLTTFEPRRIEIQISIRRDWPKREKAAESQITNIRKRLRLAVDAPKLKDLTFRFEVVCKDDGRGRFLSLEGGRITEGKLP